MSESRFNPTQYRVIVGIVVLLTLVAAALTIMSAGSSNENAGAPAASVGDSPELALPDVDSPVAEAPAPSGSADQPAPSNDPQPPSQTDNEPTPPAGASTPTVGPVTLTSSLEETVVSQLRISVVNGNGTVTDFIDTGDSTTYTLLPGQPVTLSPGAASGIDPSDINRVEIYFFEHNYARELHVGAEDNGSYTFDIEQNSGAVGGTWTLSFDVDGLI